MAKKKKNLVDAFLFREAKQSVDMLKKGPVSPRDQSTGSASSANDADTARPDTKINQIPFPSSAKTETKVADQPIDLYSDRVTQGHSDPKSDRETDRVTEKHTNTVTQRPGNLDSDIETHLPSDIDRDIHTEWSGDLDSDGFRYFNDDKYKEFPSLDLSKKPTDLTLRQYCVLHYIYFNRPFKVVSENGLGRILGMGSNNAKYQLVSLYKKGYIYKPYSVNDGVSKGSTCRVVEKKCFPLFGSTSVENPEKIPDRLKNLIHYPVTHRPIDPYSDIVIHKHSDIDSGLLTKRTGDIDSGQIRSSISSSRVLNNTTTIKKFDANPELQYWVQQGVTPKQVATWMREVDVASETEMTRFLKWSAFDMRPGDGNDLESKKEIKNPAAWFRKILLKNGAYPKPQNYESFEEAELRKEKEAVEKIKEMMAEKRRLREEKRKVQIDLDFEEMLEGKGERFKKCENEIADFARQRPASPTYEKAMRAAFEKLYYS